MIKIAFRIGVGFLNSSMLAKRHLALIGVELPRGQRACAIKHARYLQVDSRIDWISALNLGARLLRSDSEPILKLSVGEDLNKLPAHIESSSCEFFILPNIRNYCSAGV